MMATEWFSDTDERKSQRDKLIDGLRRRVKKAALVPGAVWCRVPIEEVTAIIEELDLLVDYNEDMALDAAVEDRW